jgi:hypothetical protein
MELAMIELCLGDREAARRAVDRASVWGRPAADFPGAQMLYDAVTALFQTEDGNRADAVAVAAPLAAAPSDVTDHGDVCIAWFAAGEVLSRAGRPSLAGRCFANILRHRTGDIPYHRFLALAGLAGTLDDDPVAIELGAVSAGISVVDDADPKWSNRTAHGDFEAVDSSWTGSPQLSQQRSTYHTPAGPQAVGSNYGSYSNPQVDALLDVLATETDATKAVDAANHADALLWDDLATVPLYQFPAVVAWADNVHGVRPNPTFQGLTWNVETWTVS